MKMCGNLGVIKGYKMPLYLPNFFACSCCFSNLRGLNLAIAFSFWLGGVCGVGGGGGGCKFKKSLRFIKYGYETKFDHKFCSFRIGRFRRFAINLNSKNSSQI